MLDYSFLKHPDNLTAVSQISGKALKFPADYPISFA